MDTFLCNKLQRLQNFTESLAISVRKAVPSIKDDLERNEPLPAGCPSRESAALMELGPVREKLKEVTAAAESIEKALSVRHKAKKRP